jgi:hypothetical protein
MLYSCYEGINDYLHSRHKRLRVALIRRTVDAGARAMIFLIA